MLTKQAATKQTRKEEVKRVGYPAYVTSTGWIGYDDDKVRRLTLEALKQGFTHFKMKVGTNVDADLRRGRAIRSVIDDPRNLPEGRKLPSPRSIEGKNAGPTGCVLMIDANQVWDVPQAIEYVKKLAEIKPWFIEEPTAPDECVLRSISFPVQFARPFVCSQGYCIT